MEPLPHHHDASALAALRSFPALGPPNSGASMLALVEVAALSRGLHMAKVGRVKRTAERLIQVGRVPPLTRIAPHPKPEVAMNRVLGWLLDPHGDHGEGVCLLRCFAAWVGLDELARDLEYEAEHVQVWVEAPSPSDWPGSRAPDLLVRSPNAALMIENKRGAPQGRGQFRDYAAAFRCWRGARAHRSILLAQDAEQVWARYAPDLVEWDTSIDHRALAAWLTGPAQEATVSTWTRICLTILWADLTALPAPLRLRQLVRIAECRPLSTLEVDQLERLVRAEQTQTPWRFE